MLAGLLGGPPPRRAAPYARCVAALRAGDLISEREVTPTLTLALALALALTLTLTLALALALTLTLILTLSLTR